MPYLRADGAIGWEFYGKYRSYDLQAGDVLTLDENGICVDKKKRV
jgi:hypothetical protein